MKPPPFEYHAPDSLPAALELLHEYGEEAKLLAGGQSLIPLLNFRLARPSVLVDLNRIPELDFIRSEAGGSLRLGAMVRQARLEHDPLIATRTPLLCEAVPFVAHPQIRNRGTLGGTLAHADPAAELPAVAVALGARLRVRSQGGERWIEARDFFTGLLSTALAADEILIEVEIPPAPPRCGWCFLEVARRHGDYALAGLATAVTLDESGTWTEVRLVYLSAGDGPVDASAAAEPLLGGRLDESRVQAVARQISATVVTPTGDIHASTEFKRHLCRVLTMRALQTAARRAGA